MTFSRPCFVALWCCAIQCFAQQSPLDTSFLTLAKNNQIKLHTNYIQGQTRLNNGSEYRDYLARNEEHPYFMLDDWQYGTIIYDDERYEDVPMFYDLSRDKLISEHSLNGAKLELISEKVKMFTLAKHTFVRLNADDQKVISPGFYDVLHDGQTKVYVKREKSLQQKVESNNIIFNFDQKNRVYILKDGVFYPVKNKNAAMDVFKDKKQEIKAFLKQNGAKDKNDREGAIARVAAFYDAETKKL
jgi:hypothetical protein